MPGLRLPLRLALAVAVLPASVASAQGSWTIGRPEPLPEFQSPLLPAAKPKAAAAAAPAAKLPPPPASPPQATFSDPGESAALDEVVVVGRPPGPALWRVRRGDSEVVVIGGLSPLPHMLTWNAVRVQAALKGAKALLLTPPRAQVGALEAASLMLRSGAVRLPGATPLDRRLSPALRAKFDAAIALSKETPERYAKWKPVAAGRLLIEDFRRASGLSSGKPGTTLERMAKADGVPVRTLARLSVSPAMGALIGLPEDQQLACLDAAVDEVNEEAAGARPAAQAWADGKLGEVKAHWATAALDRCIMPNARVQALLETGTADATREIEAALRAPGRTVALVDLHFLMRSNGLLDRLKADGAEITSPPG